MRVINLLNLVFTTILFAILCSSLFFSFGWVVLVITIAQVLVWVLEFRAARRDYLHLRNPFKRFPIGSLVKVTGYNGGTVHYLTIDKVYPVVGYNDRDQLILESLSEGNQMVDLCDVKLFQKA